jgi:hypothetical protein
MARPALFKTDRRAHPDERAPAAAGPFARTLRSIWRSPGFVGWLVKASPPTAKQPLFTVQERIEFGRAWLSWTPDASTESLTVCC